MLQKVKKVKKMAIQTMELDPNHKHRYRKLVKLCVDRDSSYASPKRVSLVDNGEVWVTDNEKANAVGLRTRWRKTGQPE